jgi:hypothetical protein
MNILKNVQQFDKIIVLIPLLFLALCVCYSQSNTFSIKYDCELTIKQKLSGVDSIKIISNFENGKIPLNLPDFINLKILVSSITSIGDNNWSKIIQYNNSNSGWKNFDKNVQYDSIIYINQSWFEFKNNSSIDIGALKLEYTFLEEEKEILGYKCSKVNFYSNIDSSSGYIWITQSLPSTLMPFGGYKPLRGAILECNFINSGIRYVAKSIIEIDTK